MKRLQCWAMGCLTEKPDFKSLLSHEALGNHGLVVITQPKLLHKAVVPKQGTERNPRYVTLSFS